MRGRVVLSISIFFIVISLVFPLMLRGQDSSSSSSSSASNTSSDDLKKRIQDLENKLTDIRQQKNTLSSQIAEMDTQIFIKTLNIQQTEQKITETQHEIEMLNTRINGLDSSLTDLSKLLIQRVVKGYKEKSLTVFDFLLSTENMGDFLNRVKYQKATQDNNQKLLIQVQEAKSNYEEQKTLRETKKQELDALIVNLEGQKVELNNQQAQKQKLLTDTLNDEQTYQSLLRQAQQQLTSFKSFVQTSGGDSIIGANAFGNGSDGTYYSQRDARWANQAIGYSSETILNVGCLLTSISMVAKKNGQDISPSDFAANSSNFWANTAWMKYPWPSVAGKSMVSVNNIDEELNNGNYVIVGIAYSTCVGKSGGDHYVVLTKKDGDSYTMHDPIQGPDKKFSDYYSIICSSATYK